MMRLYKLKKNQRTLLKDCKNIALSKIKKTYEEGISKERNRIENRKVEIFEDLKFTNKNKWSQYIKTVIKITRDRNVYNTKSKKWIKSKETSYFISTKKEKAIFFCKSIRDHWQIENCNHYVKDVALLEDDSRIRIKPEIMAKLRSIALNIMRYNKIKNIKNELFINCMNLERILKLYKM